MFEFAALSCYIGAIAFGLLSALLLAADQGHAVGRILASACLVSTLWFAFGGAYYSGHEFALEVSGIGLLELARDGTWLAFLGVLLLRSGDEAYARKISLFLGFCGLVVFTAAAFTILPNVLDEYLIDLANVRKTIVFCYLVIAILGLVLIEQLVRRTRADARWAIKHLCIGVGALFAYDFYLYADALLFTRIDPDLWSARGAINAMTVPMIALAAARNRQWDLNIFVSRRVVFHSTAAVIAGLYLLLMSAAGYYLNSYGGTWGAALRAVFLFGALLFLAALIFSAQIRSRVRMFLAKHFYKNRYEYGEVWLSFTRQLSTSEADPGQLRNTILRAIADIVDSTAGIMWCKDDSGTFVINAQWSMEGKPAWTLSRDHPFISALEANQGVVELGYGADTGAEGHIGSNLPWLQELRRAWVAVPILHGDELLAFLVLAEPRTNESITWEDRDLLRTVGRQAASYLAFLRATEALTEARQFEAFNRLSAFLVHDLKNVVAQLSLVVRNAEKHRDNPEFISDAFTTIGNAVAKINRMLASLRQDTLEIENMQANVELNELIEGAVLARAGARPQPVFERLANPVFVHASSDRFLSVLEHLIQNAQDATEENGKVSVSLVAEGRSAVIEIDDTGCGMDEEFIRTRLFRPFDTTKGKAGMGIGVFESRHIVSAMGGRLDVESAPGQGTKIKISLPYAEMEDQQTAFSEPQRSQA